MASHGTLTRTQAGSRGIACSDRVACPRQAHRLIGPSRCPCSSMHRWSSEPLRRRSRVRSMPVGMRNVDMIAISPFVSGPLAPDVVPEQSTGPVFTIDPRRRLSKYPAAASSSAHQERYRLDDVSALASKCEAALLGNVVGREGRTLHRARNRPFSARNDYTKSRCRSEPKWDGNAAKLRNAPGSVLDQEAERGCMVAPALAADPPAPDLPKPSPRRRMARNVMAHKEHVPRCIMP